MNIIITPVYIRENDLMKINNEKGPTHFIFMKFSYTVFIMNLTKRIVYNLNNTKSFIKI